MNPHLLLVFRVLSLCSFYFPPSFFLSFRGSFCENKALSGRLYEASTPRPSLLFASVQGNRGPNENPSLCSRLMRSEAHDPDLRWMWVGVCRGCWGSILSGMQKWHWVWPQRSEEQVAKVLPTQVGEAGRWKKESKTLKVQPSHHRNPGGPSLKFGALTQSWVHFTKASVPLCHMHTLVPLETTGIPLVIFFGFWKWHLQTGKKLIEMESG